MCRCEQPFCSVPAIPFSAWDLEMTVKWSQPILISFCSLKFGWKEKQFPTRNDFLLAVISLISWNVSSVCAAVWSLSASLASFDCYKIVTRERRKKNRSGKLWAFHSISLFATATWSHTFWDLLHGTKDINVPGWQFKAYKNITVTLPVRNRAPLRSTFLRSRRQQKPLLSSQILFVGSRLQAGGILLAKDHWKFTRPMG